MKKILVSIVIIIAVIVGGFFLIKYLGGWPVGFDNGHLLVKQYHCSDVCPGYGGWFVVYSRIDNKEECDRIGGKTIIDPAWKGFWGCSPIDDPIDDKQAQQIIYTNKDYKFRVSLTAVWFGYRVRVKEVSSNFGQGNLVFCVPTTSKNYGSDDCDDGFAKIMVIHVMNYEQWSWWQKQDGPKPGLLGQNSDYVFGYSFWQDPPQDLTGINFETNLVTGSFKFLE